MPFSRGVSVAWLMADTSEGLLIRMRHRGTSAQLFSGENRDAGWTKNRIDGSRPAFYGVPFADNATKPSDPVQRSWRKGERTSEPSNPQRGNLGEYGKRLGSRPRQFQATPAAAILCAHPGRRSSAH